MAYNITVSGRKADALGSLRQQAGAQVATQTSAYERTLLEKAVADAEEKVNQFAGDDDNVSISIHGNFSQADRALGITCTGGVSISKAVAAPAGAPAAGAPAPGTPTAPTPTAPTAAGATPAPPAPGTPPPPTVPR